MLKLCAAGDSILMNEFPPEYEELSASLRAYILEADVRICNMETTITDGNCFASTYCGGTWLTAPKSILDALDAFGFQYYGFANNHSMDYSYGGLRGTIRALKEHGVYTSGAGEDIAEAGRHASIITNEGSVGIIAATATTNDAARAGEAHDAIPGRPGVNMLRHSEIFTVNTSHLTALEEIAQATHMNGRLNNSKRGGYTVSMPGVFELGPLSFTSGEVEGKMSRPDERDSARILAAIGEALKATDYTVVSLHSHEIKSDTDDEPDYFFEKFAHDCIDAGATAVICSGTHQIKAIEVYRNKPIFYSIANFIFESDKVAVLPYDFYEKYGVPDSFTAREALLVRSKGGTRGLQTDRSNYVGLVPTLYFDNGCVQRIVIQPIELCFDRGERLKGLPINADDVTVKGVFDRIKLLSAPYGTRFALTDGRIEVLLD